MESTLPPAPHSRSAGAKTPESPKNPLQLGCSVTQIRHFFKRTFFNLPLIFENNVKKATVWLHTLSVTCGDTSPKGRGTGVSVRPTRDEQSLLSPETVVPCGLDSQQLDKVLLSRSRCPRKRGPPFCALSDLRRPAESGPTCQRLPLWGSWHRAAMTERANKKRQGKLPAAKKAPLA